MKAPKGKKDEDTGKGRGRPPRYNAEFAEQAEKLCRLGLIDKEIASFFEVDERTIARWKKRHPEFCQALKRGKVLPDAEVADRLYQRACGFAHPEDRILQHLGVPVVVPTVKHYPPDTLACIFWLKNRRPDLWRDKASVEHTGRDGGPIQTAEEYRLTPADEQMLDRILEGRAKVREQQEGG